MLYDLRIQLSHSYADDLSFLRERFPNTSDSECVNTMIDSLHHYIFIQKQKIPKVTPEKTHSSPIRTRIEYNYKSYCKIERFKKAFNQTDKEILKSLLPIYRKLSLEAKL